MKRMKRVAKRKTETTYCTLNHINGLTGNDSSVTKRVIKARIVGQRARSGAVIVKPRLTTRRIVETRKTAKTPLRRSLWQMSQREKTTMDTHLHSQFKTHTAEEEMLKTKVY